MIHATFLIVDSNYKYSTTHGTFSSRLHAHEIAFNYAQNKNCLRCECYVNGEPNGYVSRHGDIHIYGD